MCSVYVIISHGATSYSLNSVWLTASFSVAEVCKVLGMTVWGLTRTPASDETRSPHVDQYRCSSSAISVTSPSFIWYVCVPRQLNGLPELLSSSDYVCNVLPSTAQTRWLLDGDMLRHCATKVDSYSQVSLDVYSNIHLRW